MMDDKIKKRIDELVREEVVIVPYNPAWPKMFEDESVFLRNKLPQNLVKRIEHFGSTAVLGLSAKPIIDILVEVSSLDETKRQIVPILESEEYEYFWRPVHGNDGPPYYAWFIKRNLEGKRTHHIHMVEADSERWNDLYFRDYLRQFLEEAQEYTELKIKLSEEYPNDRVKYTEGKTNFILSVTKKAKKIIQMNEVNKLIDEAKKYVGEFKLSSDWMTAGYVAAAIKSTSGKIYTGICIDVASGIGFCAEHSAIAQMLKERETRIEMVVAVNQVGKIMPPCGRCREFMLLINKENEQTKVLVSEDHAVNLIDLLPYRWC